MRNILLTLSYDGTFFCGWQRQEYRKISKGEGKTEQTRCTKKLRTVQEEIENALQIVHKQPVVLYGSGRTDSGVHAAAQAANFISPIDSIPLENYIPALNARLPRDIRIHTAEEKPLNFNARFNAVNRTYRYFFYCGKTPPAWEMNYVWPLYRYPDVAKLNAMSSCLRGETDCSAFAAAGDKSVSKYRFIDHAVFFMQGEKLVFEICANAFLWKMVRSLAGTFIELEKKGGTAEDFFSVLKAGDRKKAGLTAPAQGLFLWNVAFKGKRVYP
ncbi:tRNA pseudouridine(38-40) synthase TruA [Treponema sp. OMZ 840]|uniref:tRNA pseudouridine(38-40) synthase TruA n=1 Tax=Treponema sp. OMZ 840 TaxID=244313 RepID=UPI003D9191BF